METKIITQDLRTLGIGRQYLGYNMTIKAVRMVLLDENRLLCIKQGIFVPLSEQQHCDWRTIERNIRTIIHRVSDMECAVNYLFKRDDGRKLLYACDTGFYPERSLSILEGEKIDVLILEATFGSNDSNDTSSHMNAWAFRDMLGILLDRGVIRPDTRVYASHINHKHTFTHELYQAWFDENAPIPVTVAWDGLEAAF